MDLFDTVLPALGVLFTIKTQAFMVWGVIVDAILGVLPGFSAA